MVTKKLSNKLIDCIRGVAPIHINYKNKDRYFSVPFYFHGVGGYYVFFDPWTGDEIDGTFRIYSKYSGRKRKDWLKEVTDGRNNHKKSWCESLSWFMKGGEEEGMTSIIHIPNIRTYAVLNKKEYGGFEPMDYCPFCGAKFPERLDGTLTGILQKEYGLRSWKDYKKAPHEFHTDEWWKKRGL